MHVGYQQPNFVGTVFLVHLIGWVFLIVHFYRRTRLCHLETLRFTEKLQAKIDTEITIKYNRLFLSTIFKTQTLVKVCFECTVGFDAIAQHPTQVQHWTSFVSMYSEGGFFHNVKLKLN